MKSLKVTINNWDILEIFIPFEKFKRLNKRKYFVIPTASHKLHTFVTYKRLIWIQFDPFAHYNIINEVAHNSYNKIFPFGTPFAFLKRNKIFQWWFLALLFRISLSFPSIFMILFCLWHVMSPAVRVALQCNHPCTPIRILLSFVLRSTDILLG